MAPRVLYLPGMAGMIWFDRRFLRGLREGGLDVQGVDWTHFRFPLKNLRNRRQHHQAAANLVDLVEQVSRPSADGPCRPPVLVGHSTGCLVILEALASLANLAKPVVPITILMAAAVNPRYDLRQALASTRSIVTMASLLDPVLSLATSLGGTADGFYKPAAGWLGFTGPSLADPRLRHIHWQPRWVALGHWGGHLGWLAPRFARQIVAPLITAGLHDASGTA